MDRWQSTPIVCKGGLDLETDAITLGQNRPGAAILLQNYEPALEGGYRRIDGYIKWDSAAVTGDSDRPILGVKVALGGVFAARYTTTGTDNAVYFSSGSGWTKINSSPRTGSVTKYRFIAYSLTTPVIIMCDGVNPAAKWDGSTYTLINGTGAPTNPKYAELFANRLILSGYGTGSLVSISVADDDEDFDGANDAIELNVGDIVTGVRRFRDTLYIFCFNSIWKLTGSSKTDFAISPVTRSLGCIASDSIQELGGDLVFLAADGLRSVAATERIGDVELGALSQPIQPFLRELISVYTNNAYSGVLIRGKNQYRLFIYDANISADDSLGILGKLNDEVDVPHGKFEWATLRGIKAYCSDSEYSTSDEVVVIGDGTSGYVYRLDRGDDFDGRPVYHVYRSPHMTFSDETIRKVMQKIDIYTQIEGNVDLALNVILDGLYGDQLQPPSINISQTSSMSLYGTAIYGTSTYSGLTYPVFKKNLIGSGFTVAFQYSGTTSNPPHRIDSYQITFAPKGRR